MLSQTTPQRIKSGANQFMDLVIHEATTYGDQDKKSPYRICTLTKNVSGSRVINLRIPPEIQDKIINAYEQGKTVRIFA